MITRFILNLNTSILFTCRSRVYSHVTLWLMAPRCLHWIKGLALLLASDFFNYLRIYSEESKTEMHKRSVIYCHSHLSEETRAWRRNCVECPCGRGVESPEMQHMCLNMQFQFLITLEICKLTTALH